MVEGVCGVSGRLIVREGQPPIGVIYESWDHWQRERRRDLHESRARMSAPLAQAGMHSCPTCWGARRIHTPAANGEGLIPVPCASCGATGLVPNAPSA